MPSQSIPTTVACKFNNNPSVAFGGPAGEMNGSSADFTVAAVLRCRNPGTTASLANAETIAASGDGINTGWRLGRIAGGRLKFSVAAAAGERVANLEVLPAGAVSPFKPGSLVFVLLSVTGGTDVRGFVNGALVAAPTAIVGNCLPAATGLILGDSVARDEPADTYDLVAFGYLGSTMSDATIVAAAEAARINGHLEPMSGVAINFWDYVFQADDLIDPANPGGASEVSEDEIEINTPVGLSTWQQVTALEALQPAQTRPATSTTVLTGTDTQGAAAKPLLPAAALSY